MSCVYDVVPNEISDCNRDRYLYCDVNLIIVGS